jgi:hypothetical protein
MVWRDLSEETKTFLDIWACNPAHKQKHFTIELSLNNLKAKELLYSTTSKLRNTYTQQPES